MQYRFNTQILRPLDLVFTVDYMFHPWQITKNISTAGWKNALNRKIPGHVTTIVKRKSILKLAEMVEPIGKFTDIAHYMHSEWYKPKIIAVKRFTVYSDNNTMLLANDRAIKFIESVVEYGLREAIAKFGFNINYDIKSQYYCSEFSRWVTEKDIKWKDEHYVKISPIDMMSYTNSYFVWTAWSGYHV